jgi:hypothetical protein
VAGLGAGVPDAAVSAGLIELARELASAVREDASDGPAGLGEVLEDPVEELGYWRGAEGCELHPA